nr:transcriptional regulator [Vibrio anguillarum]
MIHKALRLIRQYHEHNQLELSSSLRITKDKLTAI